jgi:hypothetical protein
MFAFCAATFLATSVNAQDDVVFWPNADYDPAVPTIEQVTGHAPGKRITWHSDVVRYFDALAEAEPKRGFVVTFTQDPNVRAYLDGLNVIFANAIFRAAAHARPLH